MQSISASPLAAAPWMRAIGRRVRTLWIAKMIGTTLGISGFFVLYFGIMHRRGAEAVTVPMTPIDHWIGVSELALLPYASLWLYVSLGPALATGAASLRTYVRDAFTIAGLGLAVFWLFPTTTPGFGVDWAAYPALQLLKASDVGGNAFPSLHVAFAAYTAVVIERELRSVAAPSWVRGCNWFWCVAIVYSTLATRQHVLVDVLGGLFLTWFAFRIWRSRAVKQLFGAAVADKAA